MKRNTNERECPMKPTTKALSGSFREIESADDLLGKSGSIWVVGISTDQGSDGRAEILSHEATGKGCRFESSQSWGSFAAWLARLQSQLLAGRRVFFYENDSESGVTDRFGNPADPFHAARIAEAVASFAK